MSGFLHEMLLNRLMIGSQAPVLRECLCSPFLLASPSVGSRVSPVSYQHRAGRLLLLEQFHKAGS